MSTRRMGMKRLENLVDNLFDNQTLNGVNGSMFVVENPDRYYLKSSFPQRPLVAADVATNPASKDFVLVGTNAASAGSEFSSTLAGVTISTAGASGDEIIIAPHTTSKITAWNNVKWTTSKQVHFETILTTGANITAAAFHAGLKLTNTAAYATDDDQVYFLYAQTDDSGALTTNANLHCIYSIAGTDYITDLGIAVATATTYRLGITIDSDRKASVFVNGVQYGLTSSTTAGGVSAGGAGTTKSLALTTAVDLIPYVGVTSRAVAAKSITVSSIKCSRSIS